MCTLMWLVLRVTQHVVHRDVPEARHHVVLHCMRPVSRMYFGPYRRSSKDDKRSFVPFAIIVDREKHGARVLEPISYVLCT